MLPLSVLGSVSIIWRILSLDCMYGCGVVVRRARLERSRLVLLGHFVSTSTAAKSRRSTLLAGGLVPYVCAVSLTLYKPLRNV